MGATAGLERATRSLRELRSSVNAVTAQLRGGFMRPHSMTQRRPHRRSRAPYSAWVAQPCVKVAGCSGVAGALLVASMSSRVKAEGLR